MNHMKKISAFFIAVLFLVQISGLSFAETTSSIYVSASKYEPYPAEAGQFLDLWLKIENPGGTAASGTTIELLPAFPFSVESGEEIQSLGTVPAGSAQLIKYRLKVDEKATSGDNILQLRYKPTAASSWISKDMDIFIQAHDAIISISEISLKDMAPGNVETFSISLENLADTYLKDVSVSLDFSSATLPFAPIDSVNEKRIMSIPSKGKENVSFSIITSPDAASGVYKVPVTLKYSDTTDKNYTRAYLLGFVVNSVPDFEAGIQKYDFITEGSTGTATISISNTGPSAIKFMTMNILPSEDYEIIGEQSIYLGNLNPDDYQTGAFKVYVNPGATKEGNTVPLKIRLKYRDGLNNIYSKEMALGMRVYTSGELNTYGLAPASGTSTTIYLILAAIVVYYLYKKYYKKKSKI